MLPFSVHKSPPLVVRTGYMNSVRNKPPNVGDPSGVELHRAGKPRRYAKMDVALHLICAVTSDPVNTSLQEIASCKSLCIVSSDLSGHSLKYQLDPFSELLAEGYEYDQHRND